MERVWDGLGQFALWLTLGLAMLAGLALLMSAMNAVRGGDSAAFQVGLGFLVATVLFLAAAWVALRGGSLNYLRVLWLLLAALCFVAVTFSRAAGANWAQAFFLVALLGLATSLAARKKVRT